MLRLLITMEIKIRFNTEKDKIDGRLPAWRLIINNQEHLAEDVKILTKSWTTCDEVKPGLLKWHLSCEGTPEWSPDQKTCTIR
jgi:hypothetical protein